MLHTGLERVLVLAPHTDDGEFGCGATIARMIERGVDLQYAAFSSCQGSLPVGAAPDTLRVELGRAMHVLGVSEQAVHIFDYEVRRFSEQRQDILENLVRINREFQPQLVLMPSLNDTHQDHQVIAHEGVRAFKRATILGYEVPWNNLVFHNSCFIVVSETHVDLKVRALLEYRSQADRAYASEDYIRAWARTRGVQIGESFAEVFEVVRWILR